MSRQMRKIRMQLSPQVLDELPADFSGTPPARNAASAYVTGDYNPPSPEPAVIWGRGSGGI